MIAIRSFIKNNRGQTLVEFALIVPILLLLIFGIFEFGRAFQIYITVSGVTRETARAAVVKTQANELGTKLENAMGTLEKKEVTIKLRGNTIYSGGGFNKEAYESALTGLSKGEDVQAEAEYNLNLIIPLISAIVGENITLYSTNTMAFEAL